MNLLSIFDANVALDGWAVALISAIVCGCGSIITFKHIKAKQKQKAGNNAKQEQDVKPSSYKDINIISQLQDAGDGAEQKQSL